MSSDSNYQTVNSDNEETEAMVSNIFIFLLNLLTSCVFFLYIKKSVSIQNYNCYIVQTIRIHLLYTRLCEYADVFSVLVCLRVRAFMKKTKQINFYLV